MPCTEIRGAIKVRLEDPMPKIHADATLHASCGSANSTNPAVQASVDHFVYIAFDMDTFEVTEGISLAKTEGELNLTESPLGTWDIAGTISTGVSMQTGETGELQITGIVTFQTGMEYVRANDEVSNTTELEIT
eukprot:CAMPEP_0197608954 /NCGR_PEP_ID=MMETSP1326-20131121/50169_1 /TAXON_ID=1155430 /ORGANISM="Genus nov. species nov., Strain RCC2288" /LENGTH=133 /DNA_ID=CAMNT_0043177245 /DNA_START=11 /DNA_END=408 /DNA_ORIENTATION=+